MYPLRLTPITSKANSASAMIEKHIKRVDATISCILIVIAKTIITETTNPTSVANAAPFMPYAGIKK